MFTKLQEVTTY